MKLVCKNLEKMLDFKNVDGVKKFNRSGILQVICPDCGKKCAGQTGRSFH
jgi:hypothetical protein